MATRRAATLQFLCVLVLSAVAGGARGDAPPRRLPVPDAAAQTRSRAAVQEIFKEDFAKRGSAQRRQLAKRLFDAGVETKNDPVATYVLLSDSLEIAASAGDAAGGVSAARELARRYAVDPLDLRLKAVSDARETARSPEDAAELARAALELGDDAVSSKSGEVAVKAAAVAEAAARSSRDASLASRARDQSRRAADELRLEQDEAADRRRLRESPDDAVARGRLGRLLCFSRNAWEEGLPLLSRTKDKATAAAVRLEMAKPADADAMCKAADAWWQVTDSGPVPPAEARQRAAYWYRRALPDLTGLPKALAQKRIDEASAAAPAGPPAFAVAKFFGEVPDRFFADDDHSIPDELSVSLSPGQIQVSGAKKTDEAHTLGRNVYHYGKAVYCKAKGGFGTLDTPVPWSGDHAFYFLLLVGKDGRVAVKEFQPKKGVTYGWRVYRSGDDAVMSVLDKDVVLASVTLPEEEMNGYGFGVTVRFPGDKAEMNVSVKK